MSESQSLSFGEAEVVDLLANLVACDTRNPPGNESEAVSVLAPRLEEQGLDVTVQDVAPGRQNLVTTVRGTTEGALVLSGHLDTVPADPKAWSTDPLKAVVKDGHVFGLGAADMKGAVAAMVAAVVELARSGTVPPRDVTLALTAGEEVDSCGAAALREHGLLTDSPRAFVIGEPTDMQVGVAHKGALWLAVSTSGEPGHSAHPEAGINAVELMLDWLTPLAELREVVARPEHPLLGSATLSVNAVAGGGAANVVPHFCRGVLDVRTVPGQDHDVIIAAFGQRSPTVSFEVLRSAPPVCTDSSHPVVRLVRDSVSANGGDGSVITLPYVTDGSVFSNGTNVPVVIVGPGDIRMAHVPNENVSIGRLAQAMYLYRELALSADW